MTGSLLCFVQPETMASLSRLSDHYLSGASRSSILIHFLMEVATIPTHLFKALGLIALVENETTRGSIYRLPLEQYKSANSLRATFPQQSSTLRVSDWLNSVAR